MHPHLDPRLDSPREFYKKLHPEYFSDSVDIVEQVLDRVHLEYVLSSLGERKQETDFEHFSKAILERTVCPNLIPQTGPTGGGDSKVDTETYPVSEKLSLAWLVGSPNESTDRWAFAFSTQKTWKDKLRDDLKKIVETKRNYVKIFFVTSESVKDRERAKLEDLYRKNLGLEVRIYDKSWILDRIYQQNLQSVAIDKLKIEISSQNKNKKGAKDYQRQTDLEGLEQAIQKRIQAGTCDMSLVDDCLYTALLARSLERPHIEIEGYFQRAKRIAGKCGSSHQLYLAIYQHAWTAYWWFEDYNLFNQLYSELEPLAPGTSNVYELELLSNLNNVLLIAVKRDQIKLESSLLDDRSSLLRRELERFSRDKSRPSAALHAQTLLLTRNAIGSSEQDAATLFKKLKGVLNKSCGLIGYPFESTAKIIKEMGRFYATSKEYDELFETMVNIASVRQGDVAGAELLVERAEQALISEQPYTAIRLSGRALLKLYKEESRKGVIRALFICASAYEAVDLNWAARGTILTAAALALTDFWNHHKITGIQCLCLKKIKLLELRLGRLPQILAWREVYVRLKSEILNDDEQEAFILEDSMSDLILSLLFLRADKLQLGSLRDFPDVLDRQNLPFSNGMLRFLFGDNTEIEDIKRLMKHEGSIESFIEKLQTQPANRELPSKIYLYAEKREKLTSVILGCNICVDSDNTDSCILVSESLLAAVEAFLATGFLDGIIAKESDFNIIVRSADIDLIDFKQGQDDESGCIVALCGKFNLKGITVRQQERIKDKISEIVTHILAHAYIFKNTQQTFKQLFKEDQIMIRAFSFTSSFVSLSNILGNHPKIRLESWKLPEDKSYPFSNEKLDTFTTSTLSPELDSLVTNSGFLDKEKVKHSDIRIVSLIKEELWERARWIGIASMVVNQDLQPPTLGILFDNKEFAEKIFEQWRKEIGDDDSEDRLLICLVKKIDKKNACQISHVHRC